MNTIRMESDRPVSEYSPEIADLKVKFSNSTVDLLHGYLLSVEVESTRSSLGVDIPPNDDVTFA